jgi:hypothetical protein
MTSAGGDEDGGDAGDEAGGAGGEADVCGGAAVAGAGAAAATASDAASAHAPGKSVAIVERAWRGTGESYRKIARRESSELFVRRTVKVSKIHGMLAHRA